jgi:hypothetical protein
MCLMQVVRCKRVIDNRGKNELVLVLYIKLNSSSSSSRCEYVGIEEKVLRKKEKRVEKT